MTLAAAAASERTETTTTVDDLHRASSEAKDTIPDSNNVIANTHDAPVPTKDGPITPRKRPWYHPKSLFQLALDNWFLIGIFVFIIIASQAPSVAKTGGHIRAEITVSWVGLAIIFLITGLTLSTPALLSNLSNFYLHFLTQIISLIVFPTVVFVIITIIRSVQNTPIDRFILIGYMVAGVMPTTVASNIAMTRTAKGNVEAATAEVCVGGSASVMASREDGLNDRSNLGHLLLTAAPRDVLACRHVVVRTTSSFRQRGLRRKVGEPEGDLPAVGDEDGLGAVPSPGELCRGMTASL